jgi:hypothetical protein
VKSIKANWFPLKSHERVFVSSHASLSLLSHICFIDPASGGKKSDLTSIREFDFTCNFGELFVAKEVNETNNNNRNDKYRMLSNGLSINVNL